MIYFTPAYAVTSLAINRARLMYAPLAGTATASTEATGFAAINAEYEGTFTAWKPTAAPASWQIVYASAQTVDCVAIGAHELSGATVTVATWNGSAFVDQIEFVPDDNSAIMACFQAVSTERVRVTISAIKRVGVIFTGRAMVMPIERYAPGADIDITRNTAFADSVSQAGQLFPVRIKRVAVEAEYAWEHINEDDYRDIVEPFSKAVRGRLFFIAERPLGNPHAVAYGKVMEDIRYQRMGIGRRLVSVGFRFAGFANAE